MAGISLQTRNLLILLLLGLLAGCAKPLPENRLQYAGGWQGEGVTLNIDVGGTVDYQRKQGNSSRSINAPIKSFQGDNFVVGVLFMETTFVVSQPPKNINGSWTMTVDGVDLVKVEP